jgi:hypothetical protein
MTFRLGDLHIRGLRIHDYHIRDLHDLRGHDLQALQTNDSMLPVCVYFLFDEAVIIATGTH